MQMVIRAATECDVPAIASLHAESWRSAYRGLMSDDYLDSRIHGERLAIWQERFSVASGKPMFVLLAESETRLAGFVCVFPEADAIFGSHLDNLHVTPELTGRGIGRQLLSAAARRLVTDGSRSGLYLWVVDRNHGARRFYERAGGVCADAAVLPMPDGQHTAAFRYHWRDPATLLV